MHVALGKYSVVPLIVAIPMLLLSCKKDGAAPDDTVQYTQTPVTISSGMPGYPAPTIPSDNPTTEEGVLLGRTLFYDPKLSADGTISCASCHQLSKGMADGLPVSIGIRGQRTNRSSMPLINLAWVNKFFWDGRVNSLEEQSLHPIDNPQEMGNSIGNVVSYLQGQPAYVTMFSRAFNTSRVNPNLVAKAIAQFERTLVSFNSKYDRFIRGQEALTTEEAKGLALFSQHPDPFAGANGVRGANCNDCHSVGLFQGKTTGFQGFMNNGTPAGAGLPQDLGLQLVTNQTADAGKMRIPTLRNIALTAPYMHAGQFGTLADVMDHYNSPDLFQKPNVDFLITSAINRRFTTELGLTAAEKQAVIAFLNTLTDTSFVNNPAFKKP
jgi:cytochrome c peroxidase